MENLANLIIRKIEDEWILAGHNLTGGFIDSLAAIYEETKDSIIINIEGYGYGIYLNEGVTADNIPYTSRRGQRGMRGGKSKYITGLHNYVKLRMGITDDRQALGIAFAIAETHKERGILGSGYLDEVNKKHSEEINMAVSEYLDAIIEGEL